MFNMDSEILSIYFENMMTFVIYRTENTVTIWIKKYLGEDCKRIETDWYVKQILLDFLKI